MAAAAHDLLSALPGAIHGFLVQWGVLILFGLLVWFTWKMVRRMPDVSPKEIDPRGESTVRWEDVAGVDEARAELEEVVEFLRDPERFVRLGARVPKGILLYGPPGTGKTLLAKAVARESGARFYFQSASSFVEVWGGLGAARIRKLFQTARKHTPAIVFIDELDAVGTRRSATGLNREQDQTLNQLLVELDGFHESERVVVIGATNRLDALDAALLRAGRFDRRILVSPPDLDAREQILRVHARNKPLAEDVSLGAVARQTAGLTGADLANICNEAAILAARRRAAHVDRAHFAAALERVVSGLEQRRFITAKEKRVIAYHEAGHALLARLVGDEVHKVTIVPRGDSLGSMLSLPEEDRYLLSKEELDDWLKVALAGRAAEQVVFGRITTGAAADLERATAIARSMVFDWGMGTATRTRTLRATDYGLSEETKRLRDDEQRAITEAAYAEAVRLVARHRARLDRLAAALLERETLDRDQLDALLDGLEQASTASQDVGVERRAS